ncbi:MAG: lytic transglycosylase domain-containing protein [Candidatus Aminicenantaceae bacterium]
MANKYNIPVELIHSIIQAESDYNKWAVSSKGAKGLMQLMPETAKDYGVKDIFDPRENIEAGVKYLGFLIKRYKGKTNLVLAAYNAGPENVKKYEGVPPYRETKSYIQRVKKLYGEQYITLKQSVRKFYDQSGKLVLTNYPSSYFSDRQKE